MDVTEIKAKLQDIDLETGRSYDIVQPKFDGFWTLLEFTGTSCKVWTSRGELRTEFAIESTPMKLLAEWNFGTNWSTRHPELAEFNVHDIMEYDGRDFRNRSYYNRYLSALSCVNELNSERFAIVESFNANQTDQVWQNFVVAADYEGLVFKHNSDGFGIASNFGRCKKNVSKDYVFLGCSTGNGKYSAIAGSVICGLFVNGKLTTITQAGGLSEVQRRDFWEHRFEWSGKRVCEVEGKMYFEESGALRHPHFLRFREDVNPEQCTLEAGCHSS